MGAERRRHTLRSGQVLAVLNDSPAEFPEYPYFLMEVAGPVQRLAKHWRDADGVLHPAGADVVKGHWFYMVDDERDGGSSGSSSGKRSGGGRPSPLRLELRRGGGGQGGGQEGSGGSGLLAGVAPANILKYGVPVRRVASHGYELSEEQHKDILARAAEAAAAACGGGGVGGGGGGGGV